MAHNIWGPYPYVVTLEVTLFSAPDGKRQAEPPTQLDVPVVAYTPMDAVSMACLNAIGSMGVPPDAKVRVVKVEPDYRYSEKPKPIDEAKTMAEGLLAVAGFK